MVDVALQAERTGDLSPTEAIRQACLMSATTVAAFDADDAAQAITVCRQDTRARELAVAAMRHITDSLAQGQASPEATVQAILAARSLERMAAHAANIAETVVFILQGATLSQKCQSR